MTNEDGVAGEFETHRAHLRSVASRLLGSAAEADDAVQEAWLRLARSDAGAIENLGGRLTTVVSRVCLDQLRARESREAVLERAADPRGARRAPCGAPGSRAASRSRSSSRRSARCRRRRRRTRTADARAIPPGRARIARGARRIAEEVAVFGTRSRVAAVALVGTDVGLVVAPRGRLQLAITFTFDGDVIAGYELVAEPARLARLELAVLDA